MKKYIKLLFFIVLLILYLKYFIIPVNVSSARDDFYNYFNCCFLSQAETTWICNRKNENNSNKPNPYLFLFIRGNDPDLHLKEDLIYYSGNSYKLKGYPIEIDHPCPQYKDKNKYYILYVTDWQINKPIDRNFFIFPKSYLALIDFNVLPDSFEDEQRFNNLEEALEHPTEVKILDLSGQQLKAIPEDIVQLTNLEILHLENNEIKDILPSLGQLTKLQRLELSGNKIESIPDELFNLKNLITLSLSNNMITTLPAQVKNLKQLKKLFLYNNQLSSIPLEIKQMQHLKILDVGLNKIDKIPSELRNDDLSILSSFSGSISFGCGEEK